MIVFSNTTPIIALSSIQQLDLLPKLFGHIHLVNEVVDECEAGGASDCKRASASSRHG